MQVNHLQLSKIGKDPRIVPHGGRSVFNIYPFFQIVLFRFSFAGACRKSYKVTILSISGYSFSPPDTCRLLGQFNEQEIEDALANPTSGFRSQPGGETMIRGLSGAMPSD